MYSKPVTKEDRSAYLDNLYTLCKSCRLCELGRRDAKKSDEIRDPHVLSNRNVRRFVLVGQNPGWDELLADEPFVGASGRTFDKALMEHGLGRHEFYITNVVKCWTPNNAAPSKKHMDACSNYLDIEFKVLSPLLVVSVGSVAFKALCGNVSYQDRLGKITKSEKFGVNVFAVYHPSPLNLNVKERRDQFERQVELLCKTIKKIKAARQC